MVKINCTNCKKVCNKFPSNIKRSINNFCSKKCNMVFQMKDKERINKMKKERPLTKNGKNINCKVCKKEFYISKSRFNIKTCCSKNCSNINLKQWIKKNGAWNKGFTKKTDKRVKKYTNKRNKIILDRGYTNSKETRKKISDGLKGRVGANKGIRLSLSTRMKISVTQSGDKEFIAFKNKLVKRIRMNNKYLEWRSNIFKRDNYHCQHCGEKGYLEAHHIYPFSKIISEFRIINLDQALDCKILWDIGNGITYCRPCHILLDKNIGVGLQQARSNL